MLAKAIPVALFCSCGWHALAPGLCCDLSRDLTPWRFLSSLGSVHKGEHAKRCGRWEMTRVEGGRVQDVTLPQTPQNHSASSARANAHLLRLTTNLALFTRTSLAQRLAPSHYLYRSSVNYETHTHILLTPFYPLIAAIYPFPPPYRLGFQDTEAPNAQLAPGDIARPVRRSGGSTTLKREYNHSPLRRSGNDWNLSTISPSFGG